MPTRGLKTCNSLIVQTFILKEKSKSKKEKKMKVEILISKHTHTHTNASVRLLPLGTLICLEELH